MRGRLLWVLGIVLALLVVRLGLRFFALGSHGLTWLMVLAVVLVLVRLRLRFYRRR